MEAIKSIPLSQSELARRVRWYVQVRWFFLAALSLPGIVTELASQGFSTLVIHDITLAAIGFGYNALFFLLCLFGLKGSRSTKVMAVAQVASDVLLSTFLIYSHGGIEARTIILYAIPIILAGALFGRIAIYATAAASAVLYDAVLVLDYWHIAPSLNILVPSQHADLGYLITSALFYSATLIITGAVADFVIRLLKDSEAQTEEKRLALGSAQRLAHIGSWDWDVRTDQVKWSEELYDIYGLPHGSPVDPETYVKHVHPDDGKAVQDAFAKALTDLQPFRFEHRLLRPDGSQRIVNAAGEVMSDDAGRAIKLGGIAQDVTEQRQAEATLRGRTEELEKLNQLMVGRELKMAEMKRKLKQKAVKK